MNETNDTQENLRRHHHLPQKAVGILMILIGTGSLITYWLNIAWVPVLWVGLGLLIWGAISHNAMRIIPGGIITGTGLAIVAQTGPWNSALSDPARTGLFLICFSLGWFLITLLSGLATSRTLWWPIVPGFVMAITGIAFWLATGWVEVLSSLVWPILLVTIGVFLIIRWNRSK
jgi:hypothetical protein